jgi:GDPmannose 4,6-dehydratase
MTTALVLGANGQDGSYLCERLVAAGRSVVGLGRQPAFRHPLPRGAFRYEAVDLADGAAVDRLLEWNQPDEIYHLAAIHGHAGFALEERFDAACDVNVRSLHRVLEHLRQRRHGRLFYASSAKTFGRLSGRVTLARPRAGRCLYALTKNMAGGLIEHYRQHHRVEATVAIMFNHESPRRPPQFFIPTVCGLVAAALRDGGVRGTLATLSFGCDWSSARDFMELAVTAMDRGETGELLFASGETRDARPFVQRLFARHGLDADDHVSTADDVPYDRFEVDISDTVRRLGYAPRETIDDVCDEIVALVRPAAAA